MVGLSSTGAGGSPGLPSSECLSPRFPGAELSDSSSTVGALMLYGWVSLSRKLNILSTFCDFKIYVVLVGKSNNYNIKTVFSGYSK